MRSLSLLPFKGRSSVERRAAEKGARSFLAPFFILGQVYFFELDLGIPAKLVQRVKLVGFLIVDIFDARVDEYLEAVNARRVGDVDRGIFNGRAVFRRLSDRVHLRMNSAEAVLLRIPVGGLGLIHEAARVCAMGHSCRGAVVARRQDILVAHDHRAYLCTVAGGALCHLAGDGHKILMPAQSLSHGKPPWALASTRGELAGFGWKRSWRTLGSWIEKGIGIKVTARMANMSHPINFLLASSGV